MKNDCFNYTTQSLSYFLCPAISHQLQNQKAQLTVDAILLRYQTFLMIRWNIPLVLYIICLPSKFWSLQRPLVIF